MDVAEAGILPQEPTAPAQQDSAPLPRGRGKLARDAPKEVRKLAEGISTLPQQISELPRDLVFVDLETTGGNATHHRITEVGIVRMENGAVIEEWSSLVNPECRIPSYIEGFTGITNEMVADAPRFAEIAAEVLGKLRTRSPTREAPALQPTQAAATAPALQPSHTTASAPVSQPLHHPAPAADAPIFVAHNARFDYSFLRAEFRRLDMHFSAKVLCTVKLSRRLFPEYPRHSLDAVMERHRLTCTARHRALGDARVLGDFWSKLRREVPERELAAAAQAVLGANKLPAYLPAELADELPEGPGVYRFFGEDDVLLYIGKSHSLRTRVLGHFAAEHSDAKEQKKARLVRRIDWVETAGDLGAQLKESEWIKAQKPLFNKRLKPATDSVTLRIGENGYGVRLVTVGDLRAAELDGCFGMFRSRKDGRKALTDIARAQSLCLKILGLEDGDFLSESVHGAETRIERRAGSCFGYQVGKCKGACVGKEPLVLHNVRLMMALSSLKLKPWPFPGRVALREGRSDYHILDNWIYLGTARSDEELAELASNEASAAFDVDVYRILVRYFSNHPKLDWNDLAPRQSRC